MKDKLTYDNLQQAFSENAFFEGKTWRMSPSALVLSRDQIRQLNLIGHACLSFYRALETLYLKATGGRSVLRNSDQKVPWVSAYLERGKPEIIARYAGVKSVQGMLPPVIRPDLLMTEDGFILTELDSVPGGIGLTAFLNRVYREHQNILGTGNEMISGFANALSWAARKQGKPRESMVTAIGISAESSSYRPEMEYLAEQLMHLGWNCQVVSTDDIVLNGKKLSINVHGKAQELDVLYRFWELFDYLNIPFMTEAMKLGGELETVIIPPMKTIFEEKGSLALFHHPRLQTYWEEALSKADYACLQTLIPQTWIMDATPLPQNGLLIGPQIHGKLLHDWSGLKSLGRKERQFVIKISGFDENAWGARSVTVGDDVSVEAWESAVNQALEAKGSYYVLQPFHKSKRITHPVYKSDGSMEMMDGRVRLCPYYFVTGQDDCLLGGALATICPSDKKIIHGMTDATLVPVAYAE